MINDMVSSFLKNNLGIDDNDVLNYVLFLIERGRLFEIEPLISKTHFMDLISLLQQQLESKKIHVKFEKPQFIKNLKISTTAKLKHHRTNSQDLGKIDVSKAIVYHMDKRLPVSSYEKELIELLETNRIVLVEGNTGCGKSTQIPKFCLNYFNQIVVSQPRRIAAVSLAERVSREINDRCGNIVGFKVRFDEKISDQTRLKFVTDGVLLLEHIPYDLIIIDEVHERKLNTDIFFSILDRYRYSRLILMSATINSHKYINFFKCGSLIIKSQVFVNKIQYLIAPCYDYVLNVAERIHSLLEEPYPIKKNILVFLSGIHDINRCLSLIDENCHKKAVFFKLHSAIPSKEQHQIFRTYNKSKVILSTNIAETSITIEDLDIVIDSGYVKQKRLENGVEQLKLVKISKEQADQRSGRVGRTKNGIVYRMYTENEYKELEYESVPEIMHSNLCSLILTLKSIGIDDVLSCRFFDCPPLINITNSMEKLFRLNAIDNDGRLTELGLRIARLPLEPEMGISLISAYGLNVFTEVCIICAVLSVQNVLFIPDMDSHATLKKKYGDGSSDFFFFLDLYHDIVQHDKKYARENGINHGAIVEAKRIVEQLHGYFGLAKPPILFCNFYEKKMQITKSFCNGYLLNTAQKVGNSYKTLAENNEIFIHPTSTLYTKSYEYILYADVILLDKFYAINCVSISKNCLLEVSSFFYSE